MNNEIGSSKGRIQCLDRAMDILELLGREGEMTASQMAPVLNLHMATVHNILTTFAVRGYLLNVEGRYRLGPAFAALAANWDPMLALPQLAKASVEEVTELTRESAVVTVLSGERAMMVAWTPGKDDVAVQFPKEGNAYPLTLATGRILVAYGPETKWGTVIQRQLEKHPTKPDGTPDTESHLRDDLQKVRDTGVSVVLRGPHSTYSVAVPIRVIGGQVIASIGASCPAFRGTTERLACMEAAVTQVGKRLSEALGRTPDGAGG